MMSYTCVSGSCAWVSSDNSRCSRSNSASRPFLIRNVAMKQVMELPWQPWPTGARTASGQTQLVDQSLPQPELLDLARRHRPFADEAHVARHLEARDLTPAERQQFRFVGRLAGLQLDECGRNLDITPIGQTDDLRQPYRRVALQAGLDLRRSDVLAADLEHVPGAPVKHDRAPRIQRTDVTGVIPAVRIERGGGLLRVLVVTLQGAVTAHVDFAALSDWRIRTGFRIDDAQLESGQRVPEPGDARLQSVGEHPGADRPRGFRHAEAADLHGLRHRGEHRLLDSGWLHGEV